MIVEIREVLFMEQNRIKCQVEECVYNSNGICQADGIEVMSSGGSMKVGTTDGTRCATFKYKNVGSTLS